MAVSCLAGNEAEADGARATDRRVALRAAFEVALGVAALALGALA